MSSLVGKCWFLLDENFFVFTIISVCGQQQLCYFLLHPQLFFQSILIHILLHWKSLAVIIGMCFWFDYFLNWIGTLWVALPSEVLAEKLLFEAPAVWRQSIVSFLLKIPFLSVFLIHQRANFCTKRRKMKLKIGQGESGVQSYNSVILFLISIQSIGKKKKNLKIESSRVFLFWKMICRKNFSLSLSLSIIIFLARIVCREEKSRNKKKKQKWFKISTTIRFLSRVLFVIIVAISQFAHHQQPIRCRALGGIRNVATRVYWSERINMDAKVIVKCGLIHRCVILVIVVPVKLRTIYRFVKSKFCSLFSVFFLFYDFLPPNSFSLSIHKDFLVIISSKNSTN